MLFVTGTLWEMSRKMENMYVFRLCVYVNTTEGKCQIEEVSDGRDYKLESNLD